MMNAEAVLASITAAAVSLAQGRSTEQVVVMAAVFEQLGEALTTIAVLREKGEVIGNGHITEINEIV